MYLVSDCRLNGNIIAIETLPELSSDDITNIVGIQSPGAHTDNANDYIWSFQTIPLQDLRYSNEDGDEPDGGWLAAYNRHKLSDEENVKNGSPQYAGRQEWLRQWCQDTRLYPLFIVLEDNQYRILDGYHRLAGAFHGCIENVACFVGRTKGKDMAV